MLARSNNKLFGILFILFILTASLQVNAENKKQTNNEFLHFGNMGGLLPTLEIEDLPNSTSNGAKLIYFYCNQCHNSPAPGLHTEQEWNHVFWKMYWRMHLMNAQFKSFKAPKYEEGEIMYNYLKTYALRSVKANQVNTKTKGASEYMRTCMQCHNLPDPQLHSKHEWPAVVSRMQRHMKSMGKVIPSHDEKNLINHYLITETK